MAKTLAEKTEWLFQHVRDPESGQPYSNARIAALIEQVCPGFSVTPTTIWNIRTGKSDNPSWKLIEGLAKAFGVTPLYFTDDDAAQQTQEELALLAALRDVNVRSLALRAQGLSAQSLATVRELIERVRELEGLKDHRQPSALDTTDVRETQDASDAPDAAEAQASSPQAQQDSYAGEQVTVKG